jgi:hypothetical protein
MHTRARERASYADEQVGFRGCILRRKGRRCPDAAVDERSRSGTLACGAHEHHRMPGAGTTGGWWDVALPHSA